MGKDSQEVTLICDSKLLQKNNSSILAFGIGRPMAHDLYLKERYRGIVRCLIYFKNSVVSLLIFNLHLSNEEVPSKVSSSVEVTQNYSMNVHKGQVIDHIIKIQPKFPWYTITIFFSITEHIDIAWAHWTPATLENQVQVEFSNDKSGTHKTLEEGVKPPLLLPFSTIPTLTVPQNVDFAQKSTKNNRCLKLEMDPFWELHHLDISHQLISLKALDATESPISCWPEKAQQGLVLSGKPTLQKLIKRAKLQYRFISVTAFLKTLSGGLKFILEAIPLGGNYNIREKIGPTTDCGISWKQKEDKVVNVLNTYSMLVFISFTSMISVPTSTSAEVSDVENFLDLPHPIHSYSKGKRKSLNSPAKPLQIFHYSSAKRIRKDLAEITFDPPPNRSAGPKRDSTYEQRLAILGPSGPVYESGVFFLNITCSSNYSFKPPNVTFHTTICHCNINSQGVICLEFYGQFVPFDIDRLQLYRSSGWKHSCLVFDQQRRT
eukprot:bmy_03743T0